MAVSDWSTTPANNTAINSINIAEGCSPANVNDAIREVMAQSRAKFDAVDGAAFSVSTAYTVTADWTVSGEWTFSGAATFSSLVTVPTLAASTINVESGGSPRVRVIDSDTGNEVQYKANDASAVIAVDPGDTVASSTIDLEVDGAQVLRADASGVNVTGAIEADSLGAGIEALVDARAELAAAVTESGPVDVSSGTSHNIATSISSDVREIDIWLNGVSMTGAGSGDALLQVSVGGTFVTTGYESFANSVSGVTDGFYIRLDGATRVVYGRYTLRKQPGSNLWIGSGAYTRTGVDSIVVAGHITLAGALDGIRIVGDDTSVFDAGEVFAVLR